MNEKQDNAAPVVTPEIESAESEVSQPQGDVSAPKRSFVERLKSNVGLITGLVSLLTVIFLWCFWLDRRVQDLVAKKIEPYEKMEAAIATVDNEDYDDAIPLLRDVFRDFKNKGDDGLVPPRLVDAFLFALANSDDPIEHQPEFTMVEAELGDKLPEIGWRLHEVAWYHLRTGNLEDARKGFRLAIRRTELSDQYVEAANTYFALAIIALVDGELDLAMGHFREAGRRDPSQYSADLVVRQKSAYTNDRWWKQLRRAYKDKQFGDSLDRMIERIEAERASQTGTNG